MKNIITIIKLAFLVLINILVCSMDIIFYTNGLMDNLLCFIPIVLFLTVFNFLFCKKLVHIILIQSVATVSCFVCTIISVCLYSVNIGFDVEGLVVSVLFILLQIYVFAVVSVISILIKKFLMNKKNKKVNTV